MKISITESQLKRIIENSFETKNLEEQGIFKNAIDKIKNFRKEKSKRGVDKINELISKNILLINSKYFNDIQINALRSENKNIKIPIDYFADFLSFNNIDNKDKVKLKKIRLVDGSSGFDFYNMLKNDRSILHNLKSPNFLENLLNKDSVDNSKSINSDNNNALDLDGGDELKPLNLSNEIKNIDDVLKYDPLFKTLINKKILVINTKNLKEGYIKIDPPIEIPNNVEIFLNSFGESVNIDKKNFMNSLINIEPLNLKTKNGKEKTYTSLPMFFIIDMINNYGDIDNLENNDYVFLTKIKIKGGIFSNGIDLYKFLTENIKLINQIKNYKSKYISRISITNLLKLNKRNFTTKEVMFMQKAKVNITTDVIGGDNNDKISIDDIVSYLRNKKNIFNILKNAVEE